MLYPCYMNLYTLCDRWITTLHVWFSLHLWRLIDLAKSTKSCTVTLFTNMCVYWKRQTTLQRDWLTLVYWWVIHSLHAEATMYAIFRHMAWCVLISSHSVHKDSRVYIVAVLKPAIVICFNLEDNSLFVHG